MHPTCSCSCIPSCRTRVCSAHTRVNPSILAEFPNEYVPSLHEINSGRENCYHTSSQLFIHVSCVPLRSKISGCTLLEGFERADLIQLPVGFRFLEWQHHHKPQLHFFKCWTFYIRGWYELNTNQVPLPKLHERPLVCVGIPEGIFTTPWGFLWQMETQCQSGRLHCIGCKGSLVWQ